jgi:hypothetical protein
MNWLLFLACIEAQGQQMATFGVSRPSQGTVGRFGYPDLWILTHQAGDPDHRSMTEPARASEHNSLAQGGQGSPARAAVPWSAGGSDHRRIADWSGGC